MAGEKWGLVGPNGAGKTTLLKSIAGRHSLDEGSVLVRPRTRVGYRSRRRSRARPAPSSRRRARTWTALKAATAALDAATAACEAAGAGGGEPSAEERSALDDAQRAFEARAASTPKRASRVCSTGLGLRRTTSSGRARPSRAAGRCESRWRGCCSRSRTSFRSTSRRTIWTRRRARWLVGPARGEYAGSVVLVSHDEAMLNGVECVAEVARGRLHTYKGGYARYFEQRDARAAEAAATLDKQRRQAEKLQGFVDKWGAQATKATTAANSRKRGARDVLSRRWRRRRDGDRRVGGGGGGGAAPRFNARAAAKRGLHRHQARRRRATATAARPSSATSHSASRAANARLLLLGPNGAGKSTLLHGLAGRLARGARASRARGCAPRRLAGRRRLDQEATARRGVAPRAPPPTSRARAARSARSGVARGAAPRRATAA